MMRHYPLTPPLFIITHAGQGHSALDHNNIVNTTQGKATTEQMQQLIHVEAYPHPQTSLFEINLFSPALRGKLAPRLEGPKVE